MRLLVVLSVLVLSACTAPAPTPTTTSLPPPPEPTATPTVASVLQAASDCAVERQEQNPHLTTQPVQVPELWLTAMVLSCWAVHGSDEHYHLYRSELGIPGPPKIQPSWQLCLEETVGYSEAVEHSYSIFRTPPDEVAFPEVWADCVPASLAVSFTAPLPTPTPWATPVPTPTPIMLPSPVPTPTRAPFVPVRTPTPVQLNIQIHPATPTPWAPSLGVTPFAPTPVFTGPIPVTPAPAQ